MYPHVLVICHLVVQVIIDDASRQVTVTLLGGGDDVVEVDPKVEEADCWGSGVAVVGEFIATDC